MTNADGPAPAAAGSVSPSLRGSSEACEVKYLVSEAVAGAVEERLAGRLRCDPHCDPRLGGAYRTATVYFDTPAWDMYRQTPGYRGRKYRLRRYGEADSAFLERKRKSRERVRKRREAAPLDQVERLAGDPHAAWPGAWFAAETAAQRLAPACRVDYLRRAFYDDPAEGPIRVTFDRDLRAGSVAGARFDDGFRGRPLGLGGVIMEFKFQATMPRLLVDLAGEFALVPATASKYRRAVDALGLRAGEAALCA